MASQSGEGPVDADSRGSDDQSVKADSLRALWEDLASKARRSHCPEHVIPPWKVSVFGDTPERLRLQVYGCCPRLQDAVDEIVRSDPRVGEPH